MKYLETLFWQIVGWMKGFATALFLPLMVLLWFFGAIGVLVCAGIVDPDDKTATEQADLVAGIIERGLKRLTNKKS